VAALLRLLTVEAGVALCDRIPSLAVLVPVLVLHLGNHSPSPMLVFQDYVPVLYWNVPVSEFEKVLLPMFYIILLTL